MEHTHPIQLYINNYRLRKLDIIDDHRKSVPDEKELEFGQLATSIAMLCNRAIAFTPSELHPDLLFILSSLLDETRKAEAIFTDNKMKSKFKGYEASIEAHIQEARQSEKKANKADMATLSKSSE